MRTFSLAEDLNVLEKLIDKVGDVILIIIDPISSYMGRETDSHSNTQVRSVLEPVKELAERRNVGVLCVSHLNKGGAPTAVTRINGSIAFTAAARIGLAVVEEPDDDDGHPTGRNLLLPIKSNLAARAAGLAYRVEGVVLGKDHNLNTLIETSRIRWDGETHARVDEVLEPKNGKKKEPDDRAPALAEAKAFLVEVLKDGPRSVQDIKDEAKAAGVAWRTLERAKPELNILSKKEGDCWIWGLPMSFDETDKTANTANTANRQGPKEDGGLDGGVGGRANDADDEVDRL